MAMDTHHSLWCWAVLYTAKFGDRSVFATGRGRLPEDQSQFCSGRSSQVSGL